MHHELLPVHGAHLHLVTRGELGALDVILDLGRGLLHVLRDDAGDRWEGRVQLDGLARAAWATRMTGISGQPDASPGGVGLLRWRGDSLGGDASVQGLAVSNLGARATGAAAFARDLLALALRSRIDHPIAASALNRWNQELRFAATVTFADGSPRRGRLCGMVDGAGLANLRALTRILSPEEPLVVDLTGCASLGAWDPEELLAGHPVAWVGARGGVADHLHDIGVPREAFHDTERAARAWLRG